MVNIQDYLKAEKEGQNSIATLQRKVRQAYDAAQASTPEKDAFGNPVGYDRLDQLTEERVRTEFKSVLEKELLKGLERLVQAMPESEIIGRSLALNGFYGFEISQLFNFIDQAKDRITYDSFTEFIQEKTGYSRALQVRVQAPQSLLDQIPAREVLDYVGLETTPDKFDQIALKEKLELLGLFEQAGVIPPKYYQDRPQLGLKPKVSMIITP